MKLQNYLSISLLSIFLASCSLNSMTLGLLGKKQPSDQEMATAVTTPPATPAKSESATVYQQSNQITAQGSSVAKTMTTAAEKHIVARDETLYSIAKRYQVNLNELRKRNGIGSDNIISVGQTLIIRPAKTIRQPAPVAPDKKAKNVALESASATSDLPINEVAQKPQQVQAAATPVSEPVAPKRTHVSAQSWVWPLKGEVVRQFNPKGIGTNGIRIRGNKGQAVHATQDGVVVYKGRGLSGYGTIVILSHDNGLLSTYGFLSKTHVEEGQRVHKRETIGTVGPANDKKLALYFEVREKGDPINPMIQIGNIYRF